MSRTVQLSRWLLLDERCAYSWVEASRGRATMEEKALESATLGSVAGVPG
jgi:hypothetical protein